jgi:hypothetical protein
VLDHDNRIRSSWNDRPRGDRHGRQGLDLETVRRQLASGQSNIGYHQGDGFQFGGPERIACPYSESVNVAPIEPWYIDPGRDVGCEHPPKCIAQQHLLRSGLDVRTCSIEPRVSNGLVDHVEELTLLHTSPTIS